MSSTTDNPPCEIELRDASAGEIPATGLPAVENINWFVHRGDYWVVGGLPGTGKSQLLATAAGLLKPARGSLRLFGQDTFGLDEETLSALRRRVGLVFGVGGLLFRELTVAQNVALPLTYHSESGDDVNDLTALLLDKTGLTPHAARLPGELPWHLRPRAALARALSLTPEVLFLDEPLREQDRRQTRWWLEFLERLIAGDILPRAQCVTLVVATSEFAGWSQCATRFAAIHQHRWTVLGGRDSLSRRGEPQLEELLEA